MLQAELQNIRQHASKLDASSVSAHEYRALRGVDGEQLVDCLDAALRGGSSISTPDREHVASCWPALGTVELGAHPPGQPKRNADIHRSLR